MIQRPLRHKTDRELRYIIKDAGEAARAMRGHDPVAEAKYLDQVNDAATELYIRRQKLAKRKLTTPPDGHPDAYGIAEWRR